MTLSRPAALSSVPPTPSPLLQVPSAVTSPLYVEHIRPRSRAFIDRSLVQDVGRNVCHGSDAVESAKKEIALWFEEKEIQTWKQAQNDWIYEK